MISLRNAVLLLLAAGALWNLSCGESSPESSNEAVPPGYSDTGEIVLRKVMTIGESSGTILGGVGGVVVNGGGTIFVADPENTHIRVFSPSGDSLTTIGREGQGPGEFQDLYRLHMAERDSLLAYDRRSRQMVVFSPEPPYEYSRSFGIPRIEGAFPTIIMTPDTSGYYVAYYRPFQGDSKGQVVADEWVAWLDSQGDPIRDSMMTVTGRSGIRGTSGDIRIFASLPFGSSPEFAEGPGGSLIHGRSDSLRISRLSPEGETKSTVRLPYEHIPVTDDDIDSLMSARNERFTDLLKMAEFPDYRPAFRTLKTDDQDRIWIDVVNAPGRDTTAWKIVDMQAKEISVTEVPSNVSIEYIRDGRVYGVQEKESGLEDVVVFGIRDTQQ